MVFNSFAFFVFFPIVTIVYFALSHRWRWAWLLATSCVFYMYFIPKYILILAFTIVVDYAAGIAIEGARGRARRLYLLASIVANVGVLAFFKYINFINDNLAALAQALGWHYPVPSLAIILPIGLSFHTFQAMSYTFEVYYGRQTAERHFGLYALYVMFYPQLVAGPIERPQSLLHQFRDVHTFDYARVTSGLRRMAWGLFKKAVVADRLAWVVNQVYAEPARFPGPVLLVATVFFAFQIYNDFSGYSDIAIGAARVMGFTLRQNFDSPYQATSTAAFWRRWHMSLSTWFRDYVFRPLKAALDARHPANGRPDFAAYAWAVAVTFVLSGLWHGANWTFVVWGALNGAYLIASPLTAPAREWVAARVGLASRPAARSVVAAALTFALITFTWIFFRARSMHEAGLVCLGLLSGWRQLWPLSSGARMFAGVGLTVAAAGVVGAIAVECVHARDRRARVSDWLTAQPWWLRWAVYYAGVASLYFLYANEGQFIYFQF